MIKQYPKVIYKGGKVSPEKENYWIVKNYEEHMAKLEEWGDKRPDEVVNPTKIDDNNLKVSDNSIKEDKPRRKKKAKKVSRKKA